MQQQFNEQRSNESKTEQGGPWIKETEEKNDVNIL